MSEAPTGTLAWGQGGIYDAIDDRLVIAAVTRYRTGLTRPIVARAGTGLNVIVSGGWLGVTDCGDRTSAVVGSRTDTTITAIPGPPTGSREDLIWVDPQPDAGTWLMQVITEADAAGRAGLLIARITVPANETLASAMDIYPVTAALERRLMMQTQWTQVNVLRNETTWGAASAYTWTTLPMPLEPGQWYRARFTANSPVVVTAGSSLNGRIGIGSRTVGQPPNAADLGRANAISLPPDTAPRKPPRSSGYFGTRPTPPRVTRKFDGRIWSVGAGGYYHCSVGGDGPGLQITVEDIGS